MARDDREIRDRAGIGPDPENAVRLVRLKELDKVRIAKGEPDIRGWELRTLSGRRLGEVDDLLIDPTRGEVVMLDVELHGADRGGDRCALVPARAVQLDREAKVCIVDSADIQEPGDVPSISRTQALGTDEARRFGRDYDRAYGERGWDEERSYTVGGAGEDLRFQRRRAADQEVEAREVTIEPRSGEEALAGEPRVIEEVVVRRRLIDPETGRDLGPADEAR